MQTVTAAGGVIFRKRGEVYEAVLIYRNGVWDLPKGKKEEGESVEECARREVVEEIGISRPFIESFLTETYHEYHRDGDKFGKTTHWYSMKLPADTSSFAPQESEGISVVEWVDLDVAEQRVGFENLRNVLQALKISLK